MQKRDKNEAQNNPRKKKTKNWTIYTCSTLVNTWEESIKWTVTWAGVHWPALKKKKNFLCACFHWNIRMYIWRCCWCSCCWVCRSKARVRGVVALRPLCARKAAGAHLRRVQVFEVVSLEVSSVDVHSFESAIGIWSATIRSAIFCRENPWNEICWSATLRRIIFWSEMFWNVNLRSAIFSSAILWRAILRSPIPWSAIFWSAIR